MTIRQYVLRRVLVLPLILLVTSIIVFSISRLGGTPMAAYMEPGMSQEQIAALRERLNLDQSLPMQYVAWLGRVLRGDLGWSAVESAPVIAVFPQKLAATAELALMAGIVAIFIGIRLGTSAASHRNRLPDHVTRIVSTAGASLPTFWFGILLLIVFWAQLGWFSIGRSSPPIWGRIPHPTNLYTLDALLAGDLGAFADAIWHLLLPAFVLGYAGAAIITRMMRSSLVEELQQDYVDAARARGLSEKVVIRRHARRNAMAPTLTVIGTTVGTLFEGTVVVEIIFNWPGMGRWLSNAVLRGDQATTLAYVLFTCVLFLVINLIVDVAYSYLDRRVVLGS